MNVQVTVSPTETVMFAGELPSSQVAAVWSQPLGTVSEMEYPLPGGTSANVCVLESVASESSSSSKLDGERPPPAVKAKSCASLGTAFFTTTIWPRLSFVNVQVTVSPAATSMFDTGLPSSQVALAWSQPLGTVSATRVARCPASTFANVRVFDSVPSASSSRLKLVGERPPPAVKAKSCGVVGLRVLDDHDAARACGS